MTDLCNKKSSQAKRSPRPRGAGGGTPSGGLNSPACTPRCAVGFPPQATRYPTPHRGVGYAVRDGARGRVPSVRRPQKSHPQGVAFLWYE